MENRKDNRQLKNNQVNKKTGSMIRKTGEELLYEKLTKKNKKWQALSYSFAGLIFFLVLIIFLYYVLAAQKIKTMEFPIFQYLAGILLIIAALVNFMDQNRIWLMRVACIFYFSGFLINMIYNMLQPEISVAFFILSLFMLLPGIIILFRMPVQMEFMQICKKVNPLLDPIDHTDEMAEIGAKKEGTIKEKVAKNKALRKKKNVEKMEEQDRFDQPVRPVHRIYDDLTNDEGEVEESAKTGKISEFLGKVIRKHKPGVRFDEKEMEDNASEEERYELSDNDSSDSDSSRE